MLYENKEEIEYVILVAVDTSNGDDSLSGVDSSLDELAELAETAGAVVVGRLTQKLPSFNSSYNFIQKTNLLCTYYNFIYFKYQ